MRRRLWELGDAFEQAEGSDGIQPLLSQGRKTPSFPLHRRVGHIVIYKEFMRHPEPRTGVIWSSVMADTDSMPMTHGQ